MMRNQSRVIGEKKVDRHFKKGLSFIIDEVESLMFLIEEEVFFGFKYGKNRFYKTKSSNYFFKSIALH